MSFQPGDEVVCVDAGPVAHPCGVSAPCPLVLGAVYTVTSFYREGGCFPSGEFLWADCVSLREVFNLKGKGLFAAARFRRVERRRDWQSWLASSSTNFEGPRRRVSTPNREPA